MCIPEADCGIFAPRGPRVESHSRLREERFSLECKIIASSFRDAVQPHSHFNVSLMALGSCRRIKIEHWSQEGRNVE